MIIFILILVAIICSGLTVAKKGEFFADYMSPKNTSTINAIFSVLIFISHATNYIGNQNLTGALDEPYVSLKVFLHQLVVVTYLFFSGFGIMESIKKKGTAYVKAMPVNRLFKLWYHFAIVIVLYTIVRIGIMGVKYSLKDYLLAYTGYTTIGNSNWYLFVTFALYIIVIVSFLIFKKSKVLATGFVCILSVLFIIFERKMGLPTQNYNTVICFPLGMIYSLAKPYIDKILMKNDLIWYTGFTASVAVFAFFSRNRYGLVELKNPLLDEIASFVSYEFFVCAALIMLAIGMMKINIKSSVLDWFGEHIFSFFILQRIPMLLLRHFGYAYNSYVFVILSFFGTIVMCMFYDEAMDRLDKIIFKKRVKKQV